MMKGHFWIFVLIGVILISCNPDQDDSELPGCMDSDAVNFNPDATIDDGSCVGLLNPCSDGSTAMFFDGYSYNLVGIGDQCWFAENLRTEHYTNGDAIPANLTAAEWCETNSGAVAVYGEDGDESCVSFSPDGDACDPEWSLNEYGRLYNWYAVDDMRGLCPAGWHVPTLEEWMVLEAYLGGQYVAGGAMKTTYGWRNWSWKIEGNGTNSSGFSALPGGYRSSGFGTWAGAGERAIWWSSSPEDSDAYAIDLEHETPWFFYDDYSPSRGISCRCLKDN